MNDLTLSILPEQFAVCRLAPNAAIPQRVWAASFWSVTRTADELSLVVPENIVDVGWRAERGWRCLKVDGVLDFALIGILAGLSAVLAEAGISIFAVSTYNTDYLLVKVQQLAEAEAALSAAGYTVR